MMEFFVQSHRLDSHVGLVALNGNNGWRRTGILVALEPANITQQHAKTQALH